MIDRVLAAAAQGDADAMGATYADDIVVEFPFATPPVRLEGRAAVIERLRAALQAFRISVAPHTIHRVDDTTVVVEADGHGTYVPTGKRYDNRYVIVYTFRDGLISGQREYFNPLAATEAMS